MREEEGWTALCSMADAHAAVRLRAARSDDPLGQAPGMSGRSDGCARSPSDLANAPAAAWNGTRQAVRPIGWMAGMPSDSSDGTDGSDGATSDRAVIMRPRRPRKNLTV